MSSKLKRKTLFISLVAILIVVFTLPLQADPLEDSFDPDDPGKFVKFIAKEFLQEKAHDPLLLSGSNKDLENYWIKKVDAYFNAHTMVGALYVNVRTPFFFKRPLEEQKVVADAFTTFLVHDNFEIFRKLTSANSITVLSSYAEGSVGLVKVSVRLPASKPVTIDVLLSRGWSSWKVHDIVFNKIFLSDRYRTRFKEYINKNNIDDFLEAFKHSI